MRISQLIDAVLNQDAYEVMSNISQNQSISNECLHMSLHVIAQIVHVQYDMNFIYMANVPIIQIPPKLCVDLNKENVNLKLGPESPEYGQFFFDLLPLRSFQIIFTKYVRD